MLRKIGGGAYGEIWLGRGVTGAFRAVKVVWREDFEDERGFEREFDGILKFEPISRSHPGLVNVLHVGRGTAECGAFYYYVMELGDDLHDGGRVNPVEYQPRTLRPDARGAEATRVDVDEVIDIGLRLAEALEHLHGHGLAHRDVKPSNVIFVNGHAKLADIGLVAERGQRTFVGTEGFVPPEGPGTAQADLYGLGKVLYEIATGKDRLDFPELPEDLPGESKRRRWLELNRIICEVCEPRVSKRRITTAGQLAAELRQVQGGGRRRLPLRGLAWMSALLLLCFTGWVGWTLARRHFPHPPPPPPSAQEEDAGDGPVRALALPKPPPRALGRLEIITYPSGADIVDEHGGYLGATPVTIEGREGDQVRFEIRKLGYRPVEVTVTVDETAVQESQTVYRELTVYRPPEPGDAWLDHNGSSYQPVAEAHRSFNQVEEKEWLRFVEESGSEAGPWEIVDAVQNAGPGRVVLCRPAAAEAYCAWFREKALEAGYLAEDHEVMPLMDAGWTGDAAGESARQAGLRPFFVSVSRIDYATVWLSTDPPGAEVYVNGGASGITEEPLQVGKLRPGMVEVILLKDGYRPHTARIELKPGESLPLHVKLEPSHSVVFGKPWQNGLEMKFVPVGELMVCAHETRVSDYEFFLRETSHPQPKDPGFPQSPDHPVVFVSREDARAFCAWLTERERQPGEERITPNQVYRLPTDLEWSAIAGIRDHPDLSPKWRNLHKAAVFFWGEAWPPPPRSGNLADATAVAQGALPAARAVEDYEDGYAYTSPVGVFPPGPNGIYDLEGNVHEWVADDYSPTDTVQLGLMRGGSWDKYRREHLFTGHREPVPPANASHSSGFRVVLARLPQQPEPVPPAPAGAESNGPPPPKANAAAAAEISQPQPQPSVQQEP